MLLNKMFIVLLCQCSYVKMFLLQKYKELDLFWTVLEIFVMASLLLIILTVRITPYFVAYFSYPTTKLVMSLGLLYFYYRVVIVFLPISPVLGPMLISIKRMVRLFFYDLFFIYNCNYMFRHVQSILIVQKVYILMEKRNCAF